MYDNKLYSACTSFSRGDDLCGPDTITITDCSSTGYLKTPNITRNYPANLTCTWTLRVPSQCPSGMVAFVDWLSTSCSDSVRISRGSHLLATYVLLINYLFLL